MTLYNKVIENLEKNGINASLVDNYGDMVCVYINEMCVNVFEEGNSTLFNSTGNLVKSYKKMGSAFKAATK